jgi:hypothetical protein
MPEHIRRFYQSFTLADMTETTEALNWSPTRQPSHALARYAAAIKSEHEQRAPIAETA